MKIRFNDISFDANGNAEIPELMVQTIDGRSLGLLSGVTGLKINPKFTEISEMSFDIAAVVGDKHNDSYDLVVGHRLIYTETYGVYEIMSPKEDGDGISLVKHVQAYSVEKTLESKRFFLEEGTYRFWNPVSPSETLLGRVLEKAPGWRIGEVSSSLWDVWRTFDQYDDYLLSFLYGDMCQKYRCAVSFDPYPDAQTGKRTINIYDVDAEVSAVPIYLDYDNLIKTLNVEEKSDELITALRPYGADELDIRDVNPTGAWLYDLSNFIDGGDIPSSLAAKWHAWEASVEAARENYIALINLRALKTSELLAKQVERQELEAQRETYQIERNTVIQATAQGLSPSGMRTLTQIKADIDAIDDDINDIDEDIDDINDALDPTVSGSIAYQIKAIVDGLSITNTDNFTVDEQAMLAHYMIEQDLVEDSFVATDIGTAVAGNYTAISNKALSFTGIVTELNTSTSGQYLYMCENGVVSIGSSMTANVIRATIEILSGNLSASFYVSSESDTSENASTGFGILTVVGSCGQASATAGSLAIAGITASCVISEDFSAYQRYAVQLDLLAFAQAELAEKATKTYEFSVDSGNFVWEQNFAPFRNQLELGKGIYLNVNGRKVIAPIIELELDFDDQANFSVLCASRFKRQDHVATLKDMIEKSYSSSRSFDAGKYLQGLVNDQANEVARFMSSALDAAKNRIIGASNQSVRIDGSGIHIGEDNTNYQLGIVNDMIAMTSDNWSSAKLAIGRFVTPDNGSFFGVNAEVIAGKLIVGNQMVIENTNAAGTVTQFRVDGSGAWLENSRLALVSSGGGEMLLDAVNGIVAGKYDSTNGHLFSVSGTTVTESYLDASDDPKPNVSFWLNINGGDAYFAGTLKAKAGEIGGFTIENDFLYGGSGTSYVALNGASAGINSGYLIWAGNATPASAPFSVTKAGKLKASNVEVTGGSITIGGTSQQPNFQVDSSGNLILSGSITWNGNNPASGCIDASTAASIASTTVAEDLVASPTILGANIYGGNIYAGDQSTSLNRMYLNGYWLYFQRQTSPGIWANYGQIGYDSGSFVVDTNVAGLELVLQSADDIVINPTDYLRISPNLYGSLSNRPAQGVEGAIYFVI